MAEFFLSQTGFIVLFVIFALGAIASMIARRSDSDANMLGNGFAIIGSLWGALFGGFALISANQTMNFAFTIPFSPLPALTFSVDKLSAFFILLISSVAFLASIYALDYVKHFYKKYSIGALGFFYNLFIASMLLVVTSSNAIMFLTAWELMSLTSYFLVVYDRAESKNTQAGLQYFAMMQIGTIFVAAVFVILYSFTGSTNFSEIRAAAANIPTLWQGIIFAAALLGFGMKSGIVPLHIWLPDAHPAAPSHVSALMSGVMIKTGIYMLMRVLLDFFQAPPVWWGVVILAVGAISALLGVLYALTEHNIKRLLAYHSIENIGIILLGLGSALVFSSLHMPALATVAIIASLFHTLNHAIFKSLLFLGAGSVISQTHTANIEEYGGLARTMPYTAFFFLIGSMAISALPPFNGFFSEWLTFQSLFAGILNNTNGMMLQWAFLIAGGALALTGGLALACFVKAFGVTFLARPRSTHAQHAHESGIFMQIGMGALALSALLLGVFSGAVTGVLQSVGATFFPISSAVAPALSANTSAISLQNGFAFVSGINLFLLMLIAILSTVIASAYVVYRKQRIIEGTTWDCGTPATPRMELTATGFSRTIITIFKAVLRPRLHISTTYKYGESYMPLSRSAEFSVTDIFRSYCYEPVSSFALGASAQIKKIQSGNINAYFLYTFIALIGILCITTL